MWLTNIMEILFGAAMLSLAVDLAAVRLGSRRGPVLGSISAVAIGLCLLLVLSNWEASLGGMSIQPVAATMASLYVIDRFTIFVLFTILVIAAIVSLFAWRFFPPSENHGTFYAMMLLLTCSLVGVVSAGDFLTLFLFWEGMSVSAYGLVSFRKGAPFALEASLKYFFLAGVGSLLALYGIAIVNTVTGTINLEGVNQLVTSGSQLGIFGLFIIVLGFGVEAAIVPLHTWLPDVYSAASVPVAAMISGTVTGTGVFVLVKVLEPIISSGGAAGILSSVSGVSSLQYLLVAFALLTMLVGNLSALTQGNLRRILAFSSIAQTGYMIAALSTLSLAGVVAVAFNIWNHGILKSNFFMLLGRHGSSYEHAELSNLQGIGRQDGRLGFLFGSSSLAMVGAPPFGMFWSELLIVRALLSVSSTLFFWVAVVVVLNIVLSIGYYYRIINTVVFGAVQAEAPRSSMKDLLPSILLTALSVGTGLLPFLLLNQIT